MKTIPKDFLRKIIDNQGILDTKAYRYVAIDNTSAKRMPIEFIGTTASINAEWEMVQVKTMSDNTLKGDFCLARGSEI